MSRRLGWGLVLVMLLTGGSILVWARHSSARGRRSAEDPLVPTTRVVRGALDLSVHTTGELRASKSVILQAPSVGGGSLRLEKMLETGARVHAGDVVLAFDPSEQQYALEQAESELQEADEQIAKSHADADVQAAQDRVDLLTAQFDVRRAQLDARLDMDLISANDYHTRQLSLEEATRHLAQIDEGAKSRTETSRASLAVTEEARTKAQMAAERARQNIDNLVIKSPIDGLVVARENQDAGSGIFYSGMTLPEYRAGDAVSTGRPVADVFDISAMEIRAKVNEQQRNNVIVGQSAVVTSDALPLARLTATVTAVSGLAQSDMFGSNGPLHDFDVTLELDHADVELRPGTSVRLLLSGTRIENVLHVPRQGLFEKNGSPIVYVRVGDRFEPRPVKPTYRAEARVAIEGVDAGTEIALVNPDEAAKPKISSSTVSPGASK